MLANILLLVQIFIAIGIVIFVHELGHFIMARLRGVRVDKFSLGFGPRLFGFKKGDTDYMISLFFFFGGFVKMAGEDPEKREKFEKWEYFGQPWWSRCLIVFAGPFMNFVFAYIVFVLMMCIGVKLPDYSTVVGAVEVNSAAGKAGLKYKDEILSVDGRGVKTWNGLFLELKGKKKVLLDVVSGKSAKKLNLELPEDNDPGIVPYLPPVIESVSPASPAYTGGLAEGDEVLKINGTAVTQFSDIGRATVLSEGKELIFEVKRGGKIINRTVKPVKDPIVTNRYMIGITSKAPYFVYERIGVIRALGAGVEQVYSISRLQLVAISKLVTGKMSAKESLGGPVMIVQSAANMAKKGMNDFIFFFAFVSVALGLFNLIIPIPVVDCGVLLMFLFEGIRGKPLSFKVQNMLAQGGFFLLIGLALLVTWNDIARMVARHLLK